MNHHQSISGIELIWSKTLGCYCEFGLVETVRRIGKEILRPVRVPINGLDISIITEELAIGASPKSHETIRHLLSLGFNHIIDLRAERKRSDILIFTRDILVSWVPTYDDWQPKSFEFLKELQDALIPVLKKNHRKLLICCGAGEHRAPLAGVLALVMMGFPLETATSMVQRARPVAEILPAYLASLRRFLESISTPATINSTNQTNPTNGTN